MRYGHKFPPGVARECRAAYRALLACGLVVL